MKRILLLTFLLMFHFTQAQWTSDTDANTLTVNSKADDLKAVSTSNGSTFVAFWKPGGMNNYELRMQLLDADGVPQFEEEGKLISNQIPMSTYTQIWDLRIDENDNVYIGFTATGNSKAYVIKTDSNGNNLWDESGVEMGTGSAVKVLPLSNGDVLVSWQQSGNALIQKLDEDGEALWEDPKNTDEDFSGTVPGELFELSNGDFIAIYHVVSFGINSNLYAQRFDNTGNAQWEEGTQLSNLGTQMNASYSYVQIDDAVYIGYSAAEGLRFDAFLQRIDADGNLPWGINGADFDTNQTNYEMEVKIAHTQNTKHIWAISTYTNSSQGERGEYVQKFHTLTGERLLTDNAKEVFAIGSQKTHQGDLQLIDDHPVFLIRSETNTAGMIYALQMIELNSNGEFINENSPSDIATYDAEKSRISLTKEVNGQVVAVFKDQKETDIDPVIYAQNYLSVALENDCETPEGLEIDDITDHSAFVIWEPGMDPEDSNGWEVIYGPEGFDIDGDEGTSIIVEDAPFVELEDLDPDITYEVYVRTICEDNQYSDWVSESFTTEEADQPIDDCEAPMELQIGEVTDSTAEVSWTPQGNETTWLVVYGESGGDEEDFNEALVLEPNYTLENLDPETDYDVYVMAVCDEDEDVYSDASEILTFQTAPMSVDAQIFEDFSFYPNPVNAKLNLQANTQIEMVSIHNLLGQKVIEVRPNTLETQIDTQQLQSGVYLMTVNIDGANKTFRIIKR